MIRPAAGLLAAVTVIAPAAPAPADRVGRIVAGLRQSPVFVDPEVSYLLTAEDRTALGRQIAAAGVPIYLAAVPLLSQDESAGNAEYLGYLLHRRLGRPGVYLVADQRGGLDWMSYQVPRDDARAYEQATNGEPLPRKLHDVIDAFARAPSAPKSDPVTPPAPDTGTRHGKATAAGLAGRFLAAFLPTLIICGLLLGIVYAAVVRVARQARPPVLSGGRARRAAEAELVRLARAIGAAPDGPGYSRAMADYDAAKLLYDEKADPGSRVGVVVLALDGQDALRAATEDPEPRCVLNPYHGTAPHRVRARLDGLPDARRPLCEGCRKAATRRPLLVRIDGRNRPYYQAPGLWEKIPDKTGDLPGRVLEYLGVE